MIEGTKLTYSDFVSFAEAQELDSEQSDESETEEEISFVIQKPSSKNRRKIISDDELSNDESEEFDSNGTFLVDCPQVFGLSFNLNIALGSKFILAVFSGIVYWFKVNF